MFVTKTDEMFLVYCFGDLMNIYSVQFSKPLWNWILGRLSKLRADLQAKAPWAHQIASHYHELESYWKSNSGKMSLGWRRSCDCEHHRNWRQNNSACITKRRKTSSAFIGKEKCDNLPPPPHLNLIASKLDSVLGDAAFETLLSENIQRNSKSSFASSSST